MGFKTLSRIEIAVCLRCINPSECENLLSMLNASLLQKVRFRKPKPIGGWIQPSRSIADFTNKKGIPLPAKTKSQYYVFKWTSDLPNDFKYDWLDSESFVRLTFAVLGQPNYQKDLAIKWTGLRTGLFNIEQCK